MNTVMIPEGFVRLKGRFSDYFIHRDGTVIDGRNGHIASRSVDNRTGYITVVFHLKGGRTTVAYLHRLLGITFLPNNTGRPIEEVTVNHIKPPITNCDLSNLELVAYKDNAIHAYRTGLRDDNIWLELHPAYGTFAWTMTGGEPLFFYSLNETARFLQVNQASLCEFLNGPNYGIKPYHDWWISYCDNRSLSEYDSGDISDPYRQTVQNAAFGQGIAGSSAPLYPKLHQT